MFSSPSLGRWKPSAVGFGSLGFIELLLAKSSVGVPVVYEPLTTKKRPLMCLLMFLGSCCFLVLYSRDP